MPGFQFSICNTSHNFEFADGLPQLPNVPRPGLGEHDQRPGVLNSFLKAFAMALGDGTKCKTCFGCPRMVLCDP